MPELVGVTSRSQRARRAHFLWDTPPHRRVENSLEKSGLSGVWEVPNWKKMVVEVMGWGGE